MAVFLLLGAVALLFACQRQLSAVPTRAATDFSCDDPELAAAFMRAAKAWADRGVYAAQIITMNEAPDAVPVKRIPRAQMPEACCGNSEKCRETASDSAGCTGYRGGWYRHIVIPDDVTDATRLHVVLMHEIGHILTASKEHLPDDVPAVMHPNGASTEITDADVAFVCERAPCADE